MPLGAEAVCAALLGGSQAAGVDGEIPERTAAVEGLVAGRCNLRRGPGFQPAGGDRDDPANSDDGRSVDTAGNALRAARGPERLRAVSAGGCEPGPSRTRSGA